MGDRFAPGGVLELGRVEGRVYRRIMLRMGDRFAPGGVLAIQSNNVKFPCWSLGGAGAIKPGSLTVSELMRGEIE